MYSNPGSPSGFSNNTGKQALMRQVLQGGGSMQGRTDLGGMFTVPKSQAINTNAVAKAAGNAAQMLLTRATTKQAIQAPEQVSEHGAGQIAGGAGSPANNFAMHRLQQLVQSGLLGGMPQHMDDPAAMWRKLSAGLSDPNALQRFLAVIHGQSGLVSEHGQGGGYTPTHAAQFAGAVM